MSIARLARRLGVLEFTGTWDALTNTPNISNASGLHKNSYYIVSVPGKTNLSGITDWGAGDWAIWNGSDWKKIDNSENLSAPDGFLDAGSVNSLFDSGVVIDGGEA